MTHIVERVKLEFLKAETIKAEVKENFEAYLQTKRYNIVSNSEPSEVRDKTRIYFEDKDGHQRYLCWKGFSPNGSEERDFKKDLPWYSHENKFTIILTTTGIESSYQERSDIINGVLTCMGNVSEIVIGNRKKGLATVLPSDTKENIDAFFGFSSENAILQWTKTPVDSCLDQVQDRLFKCWKCKKTYDYNSFLSNTGDERHMFFQLLSAYVRRKLPCCKKCGDELTIYHMPNSIESSRPQKKVKF